MSEPHKKIEEKRKELARQERLLVALVLILVGLSVAAGFLIGRGL